MVQQVRQKCKITGIGGHSDTLDAGILRRVVLVVRSNGNASRRCTQLAALSIPLDHVVLECADAIDRDSHLVTFSERKRIGGNDSRACHEERPERKYIVAKQILNQLDRIALQLGKFRSARKFHLPMTVNL
jgi:hypothetical protein